MASILLFDCITVGLCGKTDSTNRVVHIISSVIVLCDVTNVMVKKQQQKNIVGLSL